MKQKSAWEKAADYLFDEAVEDICGEIKAELTGIPYVSPYKHEKPIWHKFKCLVSFHYRHWDQDPNHGDYDFEKDKFYYFRSKEDEIFLPDRSKLEYLGETTDPQ